MNNKLILAIDPGASGGIAWGYASGIVGAQAMPDTPGEILQFLRDQAKQASLSFWDTVAIVEEVNGYAGSAQPGSAMFKFGQGVGFLHGVLMTLGFRIELVRPQAWQKHLSIGTVASAGGKPEWKRKLKTKAEQLYPKLKVTLKTADALLILDYAMRRKP